MNRNDAFKVAYVTGSRADYGIVRRYLKLLNNEQDIRLSILVTGTHLDPEYGMSVKDIINDGFAIDYQLPLSIDTQSNAKVIETMSCVLGGFGNYFEENRYQLIILLGDRYEIFAVATAAAMQGIPILHLHGGELTYGNYDEFLRHGITKMSTYHFVSTQQYKNRVIQLGEDPDNVYNLGALGAENCIHLKKNNICNRVLEIKNERYFIVSFHPETLTGVDLSKQVTELLCAINNFKSYEFIFIGSNADTSSYIIQEQIIDFVQQHLKSRYFKNLNYESFVFLLQNAIAIIGNSSSGIIEAPSVGTYTINIGDRQKGRIHGESVINVNCNTQDITEAIQTTLTIDKKKIFDNPYYKENCANKYLNSTLEILEKGKPLLKTFHDLP